MAVTKEDEAQFALADLAWQHWQKTDEFRYELDFDRLEDAEIAFKAGFAFAVDMARQSENG